MMERNESSALRTTGMVLVMLMAALQLAYALYALIDPTGFSLLRGTELVAAGDDGRVPDTASLYRIPAAANGG